MYLSKIKFFLFSVILLTNQHAQAAAVDKLNKVGQWFVDLLQGASVVTLVASLMVIAYQTLVMKKPLTEGLKNVVIFAILVSGAGLIASELLSQ